MFKVLRVMRRAERFCDKHAVAIILLSLAFVMGYMASTADMRSDMSQFGTHLCKQGKVK